MIQEYNDVVDFHEKFGLTYNGIVRVLPPDLAEFRSGFIFEELGERIDARSNRDLAGQLDALVDVVYVVLGSLYLHGLPPRPSSMMPLHVPDAIWTRAWRYVPRELTEEEEAEVHAALLEPAHRYHMAASNPVLVETCRESLHEIAFRAIAVARLQGFPFDEAWTRVHAANMKKQRGEGKRGGSYDVVKPPGWTPPDLEDLVTVAHSGLL